MSSPGTEPGPRRSSRTCRSTTGLTIDQLTSGEVKKDSEFFQHKVLSAHINGAVVDATRPAAGESGARADRTVLFPDPSDMTAEWIAANGLHRPMLFAAGTHEELGMCMPPRAWLEAEAGADDDADIVAGIDAGIDAGIGATGSGGGGGGGSSGRGRGGGSHRGVGW